MTHHMIDMNMEHPFILQKEPLSEFVIYIAAMVIISTFAVGMLFWGFDLSMSQILAWF
jgi:hypothetical protein